MSLLSGLGYESELGLGLELRESLELHLQKESVKGKCRLQRELGCESFFMSTDGGCVGSGAGTLA